MVSDLLSSILQELGRNMGLPDLHPDRNNSCLLKLKSGLQVQIELDPRGDALIIGTDFGPVPPGRYREDLFREALKANGLPPPHFGIFGFSRQADHFVMFEPLDIRELNGDKVSDYLKNFEEKALKWQEAIARNEVPTVSRMRTSMGLSMFGLKP